jgi:enamine deaminase RidA (YjgF/YER057c/UK114 family)
VANVASKYILDQPSVGSIIIGAHLGRSEHIKSNLQLMDLTLDEGSKSEIKEALANLIPIPGDCGDEYRKPPYLTVSGDLSHHLETIPPPYVVQNGLQGISKVLSGTVWEEMAGFSRAIRKGKRILVSGTTATNGDQDIGGDDPVAQTHFVIDKIEGALQSFGSKLEDVIRTRIYIKNVSDWEVIAKVHGERFKDIQPANTLVKAEIIGDQYLVEIEAEAEVP